MRPLSCKTLENEHLFQNRERKRPAGLQNRERKRPADFRTATTSDRLAFRTASLKRPAGDSLKGGGSHEPQ
jgi:hypothetical protein